MSCCSNSRRHARSAAKQRFFKTKEKNKRKKERKKNDPGIICPWKSRRSGVPLHTWSGVSDTLFLFSWLTCALLTYGCRSSVSGLLVGYYYRIVTCNNAKPTHQTFTQLNRSESVLATKQHLRFYFYSKMIGTHICRFVTRVASRRLCQSYFESVLFKRTKKRSRTMVNNLQSFWDLGRSRIGPSRNETITDISIRLYYSGCSNQR